MKLSPIHTLFAKSAFVIVHIRASHLLGFLFVYVTKWTLRLFSLMDMELTSIIYLKDYPGLEV
jgi:hypothetical protein